MPQVLTRRRAPRGLLSRSRPLAVLLLATALVGSVAGPVAAATRDIGQYTVTDTVVADQATGTTTASYTVTVPAGAKALSHLAVQVQLCTPARALTPSPSSGKVQTGDPTTGLTGSVLKWDLAQDAGTTRTYSYTVAGLFESTPLLIGLKSQTSRTGTVDGISCTAIAPRIAVTKTALTPTLPEPGGTARFEAVVTNTGQLPLTLTTLQDDRYGFLTMRAGSTCTVPQALPVGGSYRCTFSGPVLGNAGFRHVNVVSATAGHTDGRTVTATDDALVTLTDVEPTLHVVKTASPTTVPEPGGLVTYTATVTNTSVEPVTLRSFADDRFPSGCTVGQVLPVGGTSTCTFTGRVTGNAGVDHVNTVSALATDDEGNEARASDDAVVTVTDVKPTVEVTKTPSVLRVPETGGDVTFTAAVRNTSVEPVSLTALTDTVFGPLAGQGTCALGGSIAVDGTYTCTFTKRLTGNVGTLHTNTIDATVRDDEGNLASDGGSAQVDFDDVLPTLSLVKTADRTVADEGGSAAFTVLVTNTSAEPVTLTSLTDSVYGDLTAKGCTLPVLAAGASTTCTFTGGGFDAPGHTNTATVTASDDEGNVARASDDAAIVVNDLAPTVQVTKTALTTSLPEPGGTVQFAVTVTNTSAEHVTITTLRDAPYDLSNGCSAGFGKALAPGETFRCTFSAAVTGPPGAYTDTVTAVVTDDEGTTGTDAASATVTLTPVAPVITVSKTPRTTQVTAPGGEVTYDVVVTNTGAETVTLTGLTDDRFSVITPCTTGAVLRTGETYACAFTGQVTGTAGTVHTNVVTATAGDDDGQTAVVTDDAVVNVVAAPAPAPAPAEPAPAPAPAQAGRVTHTGITCTDYLNGLGDLQTAAYGVKGGKINNVAPGVFFYYTTVTAPSATFTVGIGQQSSSPLLGVNMDQVLVYDAATCQTSSAAKVVTPTSPASTVVEFAGAQPGASYVVSVKYATSNLVGTVPSSPTLTYTYSTSVAGTLVGSDTLSVVKK